MVTALWLKHQINDNKVCVVVSFLLFVATVACFT